MTKNSDIYAFGIMNENLVFANNTTLGNSIDRSVTDEVVNEVPKDDEEDRIDERIDS